MRLACLNLDRDALIEATLYTSIEPCAMCAGAIYWGGVSRVVFGLREAELRALTGDDPTTPPWPCLAARCSLVASARSASSGRCWRMRPERCTRVIGERHPDATKSPGVRGASRSTDTMNPSSVNTWRG
jgi:MafB19-like deaminase